MLRCTFGTFIDAIHNNIVFPVVISKGLPHSSCSITEFAIGFGRWLQTLAFVEAYRLDGLLDIRGYISGSGRLGGER